MPGLEVLIRRPEGVLADTNRRRHRLDSPLISHQVRDEINDGAAARQRRAAAEEIILVDALRDLFGDGRDLRA